MVVERHNAVAAGFDAHIRLSNGHALVNSFLLDTEVEETTNPLLHRGEPWPSTGDGMKQAEW